MAPQPSRGALGFANWPQPIDAQRAVSTQFCSHPSGIVEKPPALVADLLNRRVAVIASTGGPAVVEAAAAATATVPIVFVSSDIILKTGVITSLNRPSRNLTGVVMSTSALLSKCPQF